MNDFRCSKHPDVNLTGLLRSGAGHCSSCGLYVQAAGVPEPERIIPRPPIEEARKIKARQSRASGRYSF